MNKKYTRSNNYSSIRTVISTGLLLLAASCKINHLLTTVQHQRKDTQTEQNTAQHGTNLKVRDTSEDNPMPSKSSLPETLKQPQNGPKAIPKTTNSQQELQKETPEATNPQQKPQKETPEATNPQQKSQKDGLLNLTYLYKAIKQNNIVRIKKLLEYRNININYIDKEKGTPLYYAVSHGDNDGIKRPPVGGVREEIAIFLTKHPTVDLESVQSSNKGLPLLYLAAKNGYTKVIKELVCLSNSHTDIIIMGNLDVNITSDKQWTALHWAAARGYTEIVKELVKLPSIDINAKNNRKYTPLHLAAENGYKEVVEVLVNCKKIDINAKDQDNRTPSALAFLKGGSDSHKEIQTILAQKSQK